MASPHETILQSRYKLVSQLGAGGLAVTYKAEDQLLNRIVAIRALRPSLVTDPESHARFWLTERIKGRLSHPNIANTFEIEKDRSTHFIVMEYVEGSHLKRFIQKEPVFEKHAVDLVLQICSALEYAHGKNVIHASIKATKIMVTPTNQIKLLDFGQIYWYDNPAYQSVWASPHYLSPEQAIGERPTEGSDIYSLGIVMFEMLTGKLPYSMGSQMDLAVAHVKAPSPLVSAFVPTISDALTQIVYKAMSKKPSDRFLTVRELRAALEQIAG